MDSEDIGPRDLENLRVPAIARVGRDEAHAWQLFDAGGSAPRTINHALSVISEIYTFPIDADLGPLENPVPTTRSDT